MGQKIPRVENCIHTTLKPIFRLFTDPTFISSPLFRTMKMISIITIWRCIICGRFSTRLHLESSWVWWGRGRRAGGKKEIDDQNIHKRPFFLWGLCCFWCDRASVADFTSKIYIEWCESIADGAFRENARTEKKGTLVTLVMRGRREVDVENIHHVARPYLLQ